mgnify:CR=1 FL=1
MLKATALDSTRLGEQITDMVDQESPDAAIIIPVNARCDLCRVVDLLEDIARYDGPDRFQILLVVNNYDPDHPPTEHLELYSRLGVQTVAVTELPGDSRISPALRARMLALPYTNTRACIFFDADCRIPDPGRCLGWYCQSFRDPDVMLAYTKVGYYNWPDRLPVQLWLAVHYGWRAFKRNCLRVPTPRGSSYAIDRNLKQRLFEDGYLADETALGRLVKGFGYRSSYTRAKSCRVLTDGRVFQRARVHRLFTKYAFRRLKINVNNLIIRQDAARYTGRKGQESHKVDGQVTEGLAATSQEQSPAKTR